MNILITSAGRRSYLIKYFQDALRGEGKVFASNSNYTIALQRADGHLITPLIYDEQYIPSIIKFCKKNDIQAVISVFDIDLLVLSKNKELIESNGIKLLLSEEGVVEICNDKWKTHQYLSEHSIKTPKTYKNITDFKDALNSNKISYPVVVKPRWGMASMGIYAAENESELDIFYSKSLKDINNSYLKYESSFTPDEMVLIQEKLSGQEYGIDVINDLGGKYVCNLPKSKLTMRAGETDLGRSESPKKFHNLAFKLSSALQHEVILSVDCFDVDGDLYVTELNCRISGHYPLSHLAGVNLPKQIIAWLKGMDTDMANFKFREGVTVTKDLNPVILNI